MPRGLKRFYGAGDLHYITFSCYQRRPLLGSAQRRDLFLKVLERVRRRYRFVVIGYVVMPEHVHLLLSEPQDDTPSKVMQALKLSFARRLLAQQRRRRGPRQLSLFEHAPRHVWQARFYDFNAQNAMEYARPPRFIDPGDRGRIEHISSWITFRL